MRAAQLPGTGDEQPQEIAHYWRAPDVGDLELLRATFVTHRYARHTHEEYAIGVIERGAETFYYRHADHVAPAGSLVLINPGEVHTGSALTEDGWSYRMIYPSAELLRGIASDRSGRAGDVPFFPSAIVEDRQLAALFIRTHVALEQPVPALERESLLTTFFAALIGRHAERQPPPESLGRDPEVVRRTVAYLRDHLAENVSLATLAAETHLSPFHLLRVFRAATGLPPHAYLTQLRVARARELLDRGWPPAQVAAVTGFTDQSHLTRHFKRWLGVAPAKYAARNER